MHPHTPPPPAVGSDAEATTPRVTQLGVKPVVASPGDPLPCRTPVPPDESPECAFTLRCPRCHPHGNGAYHAGEERWFVGIDPFGRAGDECGCDANATRGACDCTVQLVQQFTSYGPDREPCYESHEDGPSGAEVTRFRVIACFHCATELWRDPAYEPGDDAGDPRDTAA